jgi:hypothetical protein
MKYAIEMGSRIMIYIVIFVKVFRHSKLIEGIHRHTDSMEIA